MLAEVKPLLSVAFSSRALFGLDESHKVYEQQGLDAFISYQQSHEKELLEPGPALHLALKLQRLNDLLLSKWPNGCIRMILISRNSPDTGLRVLRSLDHYGLKDVMAEGVFTGGETPWQYAERLGCQLFLSRHSEDVRGALDVGMAAATMLDWQAPLSEDDVEIRFAFDGDSVLFSDESERVYREQGKDGFEAHEREHADSPMSPGPYKPLIETLNTLQKMDDDIRRHIRTALVTARGLATAERPTQTLRSWDVRVDQMMFCNGDNKLPVLAVFKPDIYFDDRLQNCAMAGAVTASGHVNSGVSNTKDKE